MSEENATQPGATAPAAPAAAAPEAAASDAPAAAAAAEAGAGDPTSAAAAEAAPSEPTAAGAIAAAAAVKPEHDSYSVVLSGKEPYVKGFVRGLYIGTRAGGWPVFHDEYEIERGHIGATLKEWIGLAPHHTHVIIRGGELDLLRSCIANPRASGIEWSSAQPILAAHFEFRFTVFNREIGDQVHSALKQLPPGVVVSDYAPEEKIVDDAAKGVELYSVVHDYELRGSGRVSGAFRGVLYVHEQLRRISQVQQPQLSIDLGSPID